ncbi:insecticidal toxin complex protein [uncultured Gammaproteobacteria bacterium]|nr:insecticidal toxin complex protein [uncultured Gammaproteobacteria bacterium]VVH64141.1 insecticidal toxin complex protein [uncultured Gammaproteobacteria bacterium]
MTITLNHLNNIPTISLIEPYCQTYTYDIGNNLTHLSHQAKSNTWQQTLTIHPNSNRGTENNNQNNFDTNGNLLHLDNIANLDWYYNNTLNKLTKADKSNTTQYYVYDYQGNRVRTVIESNHQVQSQRDYLPSLDLSINQAKQQSSTLHIGTHILSESSKDNAKIPNQTRYQLTSHLQSNALELDDKAQTLSYEHYYPYGGTALIAGKDKTQVQQKRYRYTGKERDDSSGLCYYGARYLAPWLARWISPDSAGAVEGLNLYVYVDNNPIKYRDPTGHVKETPEQQAIEEGAVGGVEKSEAEKHTTIDKNISSIDLTTMRKIRQDVLQWGIFKDLGKLDSSSRFFEEDGSVYPYQEHTAIAENKIKMLRENKNTHLANMISNDVPFFDALVQFSSSGKLKDMVFKQYKAANCGECSDIMLHELNRHYPDMVVEILEVPGHAFNLLNRDQSTPLFKPDKWNADTLIIDAWKKKIYIKGESMPEYYHDHINSGGEFINITKHQTQMNLNIFTVPKKK